MLFASADVLLLLIWLALTTGVAYLGMQTAKFLKSRVDEQLMNSKVKGVEKYVSNIQPFYDEEN